VVFDHLSDSTFEIKGWWPLGVAPIQRIRFANGVDWTSSQLTTMANTIGDYNQDGVSDVAAYYSGDSLTSADPDGDGLTTRTEISLGLNPHLADSDGDGILDGLDPRFSGGAAGPLVITLLSPSSAVLTN
jgi:hypothetical protein